MIEVRHLTKVYGHTRAVDDLSFSVQPGIVTGFLGPNGAGKSTTMRMILGLDNPTGGSATVMGHPYAKLEKPLTKVGSLLEATWMHPNRSARSHLRWLARSNDLPTSRIGEVLDLVGLTDVAKKNAGKFSLGMKQRLGLAGALLGDPQVLMFDEPVNGLDPEGILWIRTLMRNLASQGRTVLVSSHLLSEMSLTADHLIVIGKGKLIADSPTQAFIAAATQSTVRVRSPRMGELAEVVVSQLGGSIEPVTEPGAGADAMQVTGVEIERIGEAAAAAGLPLHELSPQNGSLEQAFMDMTGQSAEFAGHQQGGGAVDGAGAVAGGAVPDGAVPAGAVPGGAAPSSAAQWDAPANGPASGGAPSYAAAPATNSAAADARHAAPEGK